MLSLMLYIKFLFQISKNRRETRKNFKNLTGYTLKSLIIQKSQESKFTVMEYNCCRKSFLDHKKKGFEIEGNLKKLLKIAMKTA